MLSDAAIDQPTRRARTRLKAAGIVIGAGPRRRRMTYRLETDETLLAALSLGPIE